MTKVALLLTGQLRTWKMCRILIDKIKDNYDVDIFLSIDKDNSLQHEYSNNIYSSNDNEINEVIEYFKPKDVFISSNYDNNYIYNKLSRFKVVYTPISIDKVIENTICKKIDNRIIINNLYNINNCIKTEKFEDFIIIQIILNGRSFIINSLMFHIVNLENNTYISCRFKCARVYIN